MSIRRLAISNLLGIEAIEISIDPSGAIIEGGNARGKTTVMRAIKAALDGAGISGDAVRKGASSAEIVIDLDHDSVRRRISSDGKTKLDVEDSHGVPRKKPAEFLSSLLGLALLDPLDLYLAKPEQRRALILRALPCTLTPEMVNEHLPPWHEPVTAADCAGHGIEALAAIRDNVAGYRVALSRKVKELREDVTRTRIAAEATEQAAAGTWPTREEGADAMREAVETLATHRARLAAAAAARSAGEKTRAQVEKIRARAAHTRAKAPALPTSDETAAATLRLSKANDETDAALRSADEQVRAVRELEVQLEIARSRLVGLRTAADAALDAAQRAAGAVRQLEEQREQHVAAQAEADEADAQAAELEATLLELAQDAPTDEETGAAERAHGAAELLVHRAVEGERLQTAAAEARIVAATAEQTLRDTVTRWEEIDRAVKTLTLSVPAQLLAGTGEALSGIEISESTILVHDSHGQKVPLEQLNTAGQMAFALAVAKRLNAKSRLLLVDGLERIDDEHRALFVAMAIDGGYQLFATRVTAGPLSVRPIGEAVSS